MKLTPAAKIESEGLHDVERDLLESLVKEAKLRQLLETTQTSLAAVERQRALLLKKLNELRKVA